MDVSLRLTLALFTLVSGGASTGVVTSSSSSSSTTAAITGLDAFVATVGVTLFVGVVATCSICCRRKRATTKKQIPHGETDVESATVNENNAPKTGEKVLLRGPANQPAKAKSRLPADGKASGSRKEDVLGESSGTDRVTVLLDSRENLSNAECGLGFNVCGDYKTGEVFISDVLPDGPAKTTGKVNAGDRLVSIKISTESMQLEDALIILSYSSQYPVELCLEPASTSGKQVRRSSTILTTSTMVVSPANAATVPRRLTLPFLPFADGSDVIRVPPCRTSSLVNCLGAVRPSQAVDDSDDVIKGGVVKFRQHEPGRTKPFRSHSAELYGENAEGGEMKLYELVPLDDAELVVSPPRNVRYSKRVEPESTEEVDYSTSIKETARNQTQNVEHADCTELDEGYKSCELRPFCSDNDLGQSASSTADVTNQLNSEPNSPSDESSVLNAAFKTEREQVVVGSQQQTTFSEAASRTSGVGVRRHSQLDAELSNSSDRSLPEMDTTDVRPQARRQIFKQFKFSAPSTAPAIVDRSNDARRTFPFTIYFNHRRASSDVLTTVSSADLATGSDNSFNVVDATVLTPTSASSLKLSKPHFATKLKSLLSRERTGSDGAINGSKIKRHRRREVEVQYAFPYQDPVDELDDVDMGTSDDQNSEEGNLDERSENVSASALSHTMTSQLQQSVAADGRCHDNVTSEVNIDQSKSSEEDSFIGDFDFTKTFRELTDVMDDESDDRRSKETHQLLMTSSNVAESDTPPQSFNSKDEPLEDGDGQYVVDSSNKTDSGDGADSSGNDEVSTSASAASVFADHVMEFVDEDHDSIRQDDDRLPSAAEHQQPITAADGDTFADNYVDAAAVAAAVDNKTDDSDAADGSLSMEADDGVLVANERILVAVMFESAECESQSDINIAFDQIAENTDFNVQEEQQLGPIESNYDQANSSSTDENETSSLDNDVTDNCDVDEDVIGIKSLPTITVTDGHVFSDDTDVDIPVEDPETFIDVSDGQNDTKSDQIAPECQLKVDYELQQNEQVLVSDVIPSLSDESNFVDDSQENLFDESDNKSDDKNFPAMNSSSDSLQSNDEIVASSPLLDDDFPMEATDQIDLKYAEHDVITPSEPTVFVDSHCSEDVSDPLLGSHVDNRDEDISVYYDPETSDNYQAVANVSNTDDVTDEDTCTNYVGSESYELMPELELFGDLLLSCVSTNDRTTVVTKTDSDDCLCNYDNCLRNQSDDVIERDDSDNSAILDAAEFVNSEDLSGRSVYYTPMTSFVNERTNVLALNDEPVPEKGQELTLQGQLNIDSESNLQAEGEVGNCVKETQSDNENSEAPFLVELESQVSATATAEVVDIDKIQPDDVKTNDAIIEAVTSVLSSSPVDLNNNMHVDPSELATDSLSYPTNSNENRIAALSTKYETVAAGVLRRHRSEDLTFVLYSVDGDLANCGDSTSMTDDVPDDPFSDDEETYRQLRQCWPESAKVRSETSPYNLETDGKTSTDFMTSSMTSALMKYRLSGLPRRPRIAHRLVNDDVLVSNMIHEPEVVIWRKYRSRRRYTRRCRQSIRDTLNATPQLD